MGYNVDDWNSHNSPSRVARNWGEQPMPIQARHYANPTYTYTAMMLFIALPGNTWVDVSGTRSTINVVTILIRFMVD